MNALAKQASQTDVVEILGNSLYPGAKRESVEMVLAWCRATGRDPMKRPIHIVPMYVKDAETGQGGMRDVLMPGIGTYRTDAANSGEYAGKDEPVFGPTITRKLGGVEVTYPEWCKVTVHRLVKGTARQFTAKEYWLENYATAKRDTDAPNAMWKKRAFGQLAKCAESQALRMAFPDETGNTNTAEEMEGKTFDGVTIDGAPEPVRTTRQQQTAAEYLNDDIPALAPEPPKPDPLVSLRAKLAACVDYADVVRVADAWQRAVDKAKAAGRPFSDEVIDTATELLADRMGEVPAPAPAAPSLDEELEGALG